MLVLDEAALKACRSEGVCLYCGRSAPTDPHHTFFTRGMGGGTRLDLAENLAPLCRSCHDRAGGDKAMNVTIQWRIAKRLSMDLGYQVNSWNVKDWLNDVLLAPKEGHLPVRPWAERFPDGDNDFRVHRDGRIVYQDRDAEPQGEEAADDLRADEAPGIELGEPSF